MISTGANWDPSQWGTWRDPIHKSDLNGIVGKFGCTEQFSRKKQEQATGTRTEYAEASGKLICGNATHATMARFLRNTFALEAALAGKHFSLDGMRKVFLEEYERERNGQIVTWFGKGNGDKWIEEQCQILHGWVNDLHNHVGKAHLVEAGFILCIDGIWLTGMTDLVYSPPGSEELALADWKTGAQKPHQIDLNHGWESGIYSAAIKDGFFIPGERVMPVAGVPHRDSVESACIDIAGLVEAVNASKGQTTMPSVACDPQAALDATLQMYGAISFGRFPWRIRHVHLRDYIPYARTTTRLLERPEDLEWKGLAKPARLKFEKGDLRGPAWLHVQRSAKDIPRLAWLLNSVVDYIRHGKFAAAPGEMCTRCKFRNPCLNDGYQPVGEDKIRLDIALEGLGDFDGMEDMMGEL